MIAVILLAIILSLLILYILPSVDDTYSISHTSPTMYSDNGTLKFYLKNSRQEVKPTSLEIFPEENGTTLEIVFKTSDISPDNEISIEYTTPSGNFSKYNVPYTI